MQSEIDMDIGDVTAWSPTRILALLPESINQSINQLNPDPHLKIGQIGCFQVCHLNDTQLNTSELN